MIYTNNQAKKDVDAMLLATFILIIILWIFAIQNSLSNLIVGIFELTGIMIAKGVLTGF